MVYQWYINHLGFLFPVFKPTELKCNITVSVHKEDDYQSFFIVAQRRLTSLCLNPCSLQDNMLHLMDRHRRGFLLLI